MAASGGAVSSRSAPAPPEGGCRWLVEVAPRLLTSGTLVGAMVVDRMTLQVANTSEGRLPTPVLASHRWGLMKATVLKQASVTTLQFACTRELKFLFDRVQPSPAFSVMAACGISGVPISSLSYNWSIQDTYRYFEMPPPEVRSAADFLRQKVMPGILWASLRAGCSTGGGLVLGMRAASVLDDRLRGHGLVPPAGATRLASGLAVGASTSLATQGFHNICLVAGRMAALGVATQAPHYTTFATRTAWEEMGFTMFYKNFGARMAINAVTVGVLTFVDIFHRPELSGWSFVGSR